MVHPCPALKSTIQTLNDLQTALCTLLAKSDFDRPTPSLEEQSQCPTVGHRPAKYPCQKTSYHKKRDKFCLRPHSHKKRGVCRQTSRTRKLDKQIEIKTPSLKNRSGNLLKDREVETQLKFTRQEKTTPEPCKLPVHLDMVSLEEQLKIRRQGSVCRVRSRGGDIFSLPEDVLLTTPVCTPDDETSPNVSRLSDKDSKRGDGRVGDLNVRSQEHSSVVVISDVNQRQDTDLVITNQRLGSDRAKFSISKSIPTSKQSSKTCCGSRIEGPKEDHDKGNNKQYLIISKMVEMQPKSAVDDKRLSRHDRLYQVSCNFCPAKKNLSNSPFPFSFFIFRFCGFFLLLIT